MNICFICGGLEPGKSGVGDYARRLAFALTQAGHITSLIACNDEHVQNIQTTSETIDSHDVFIYRIPGLLPESQRFQLVKEQIEKSNPDWLSLQFVLFSFDKKGLPLKLSYFLQHAGGRRNWNIMFHELWVGTLLRSSLKLLVWGWLQKQIIIKLVAGLQVKTIHTQTTFYKALLEQNFQAVTYLPLFSNIPVQPIIDKAKKAKDIIILILFGTIHEASNFNLLIEECISYGKKHNQKIALQLVGRNGNHQNSWTEKWTNAGLLLEIAGEQPANIISELLSNADIGIATSAYSMLEKSGTVAAMLDHQLPVLCVSKFESPRNLPLKPLPFHVFETKKGCIEACLQYPDMQPSGRDVYSVAKQFAHDLETATLNKLN